MIAPDEPPVDFVYYMTLHATKSFVFPLSGLFANSSKWALRNNVCRTALLSRESTYLHLSGSGLDVSSTVLLPSEFDCDNVDGEPNALHLSNIVEGYNVAEHKNDPAWRLKPPPSSCRVLVQAKPYHRARVTTNDKQLSLYGLHNDTHELLAVSDGDNLDQIIASLHPCCYWHQRLAKFSLGDIDVNTQRVFSRWQRWRKQGLSLSQRYAALESGLVSSEQCL